MLSLLWIIPVSLGITWVAFRVLQIGCLFIAAVWEWLWSPAGQREIDKATSGIAVGVLLVSMFFLMLGIGGALSK